MNRIDCEKCLHSDFDDQDRLRCGLKKCQPEYSDMKETREALLSCFPNSFITKKKHIKLRDLLRRNFQL